MPSKENSTEHFFRYTQREYLQQLLSRRALRLGSPLAWADKNDAFTVDLYRTRLKLGRVLALCMTTQKERSHHWSNFAKGPHRVCIRFKRSGLIEWAKGVPGMQCEPVQYRTLDELEGLAPTTPDLPFLKRYAYIEENEYRLLYGDEKSRPGEKWFDLDLQLIDLITIDPELDKTTSDAIRAELQATLKRMKLDIKVQQSRLLENPKWKRLVARTPSARALRSKT